jgi:hypothetical protein
MNVNGLEQAEALLHDAFLTLSSIQLSDGKLTISGFTTRQAGLLRLGKFRAELLILGVASYEVVDEANIDQIDVDEIAFSDGVLRICGKMPVELRVRVDAFRVEASVSETPFMTKRFLRWRVPRVG